MDRTYIDDHHVVARYLADRLSEDERAAFEAYYLEHPEMVQELEAAARFKTGLMHLRDTGELAKLLQPKPRYLQWQFVAATAATIVLALGIYIALARGPAIKPLLASSVEALHFGSEAASANVRSYAVLRTRGNSVDADIAPLQAGQAVELRVLPEFSATPPRFRARLSRMTVEDSREAIAELGGLVPAPDGFVKLFLPGARLKPGQYELTISGELDTDARDEQSVFIIRIRPTATDRP